MSEFFSEPKPSGERVKFELDLFNYATKAELKNATSVDTPKCAKKVDLARLKSNVDKLDIDKFKNLATNLSKLKSKVDKLDANKLVPALVDLSKLNEVVKHEVAKKDVHNAKIKNIEDKIPDMTNLSPNTTINGKKNEVKKEITSVTNLAATTAPNAKINEVKNKIPNIINLATTTALTTVETKRPNVSNLVKNTDYKKNSWNWK